MEIVETLFLFCFGSIGVTHIIVDGEIFRPVKEILSKKAPAFLNKLLSCYQCTGFWVGLFFSIFLYCDFNYLLKTFVVLLLAGGASSCLSYFWALMLTYLEANSIIRIDQNVEQHQ